VYGRASCVKMVGMAEVGAPISLDGVAVHSDCWCIRLCYLHFAPENPEDGKMYLPVPAYPGCSGQIPESHKMVVLCVCGTALTSNSRIGTGYLKKSVRGVGCSDVVDVYSDLSPVVWRARQMRGQQRVSMP